MSTEKRVKARRMIALALINAGKTDIELMDRVEAWVTQGNDVIGSNRHVVELQGALRREGQKILTMAADIKTLKEALEHDANTIKELRAENDRLRAEPKADKPGFMLEMVDPDELREVPDLHLCAMNEGHIRVSRFPDDRHFYRDADVVMKNAHDAQITELELKLASAEGALKDQAEAYKKDLARLSKTIDKRDEEISGLNVRIRQLVDCEAEAAKQLKLARRGEKDALDRLEAALAEKRDLEAQKSAGEASSSDAGALRTARQALKDRQETIDVLRKEKEALERQVKALEKEVAEGDEAIARLHDSQEGGPTPAKIDIAKLYETFTGMEEQSMRGFRARGTLVRREEINEQSRKNLEAALKKVTGA